MIGSMGGCSNPFFGQKIKLNLLPLGQLRDWDIPAVNLLCVLQDLLFQQSYTKDVCARDVSLINFCSYVQ